MASSDTCVRVVAHRDVVLYNSSSAAAKKDLIYEVWRQSMWLSNRELICNGKAVNGRDLSDAHHDEVAAAFDVAREPITVVLSRSEVAADQLPRYIRGKCNASTQTSAPASSLCNRCMMTTSGTRNFQHAAITSDLLRYQSDRRPGTFPHPTADPRYSDGFCYQLETEEVILKRPTGSEKLGITLCDEVDPCSNRTYVTVTQISPGSLAKQSELIYEGDYIFQIDGTPIKSMNHAAELLMNGGKTVTFLIGRSNFMTDSETHFTEEQLYGPSPADRLHKEAASRDQLGRKDRETSLETKQISDSSSGTAQSALSKRSASGSAKDSGIGYTLQSSVQMETLEKASRISTDGDQQSVDGSCALPESNSLAREFTYIQPQEYHFKKHVSFSQPSTATEIPVNHRAVYSPGNNNNNTGLQQLSLALNRFELEDDDYNWLHLSSADDYDDDDLQDFTSPWVRIAREDYEEKLRQLGTHPDVRSIHPALADHLPSPVSGKTESSSNDARDNTSSAYSTGDSFRSSRSSDSQSGANKENRPFSGPEARKSRHVGVTMTYPFSSDANSDGEGPECFLTHCEDSNSEGFEDAGLEFSSIFTKTPSAFRPVPLPRILHPPQEATSFMGHSLTASTRNLWRAAAAAARGRRHVPQDVAVANDQSQDNQSKENTKDSSREVDNEQRHSSSKNCEDAADNSSVVNCTRIGHVNESQAQDVGDSHLSKANSDVASGISRSSNNAPRNSKNLRSSSCSETEKIQEQAEDVRMEWKVRVSRDGTRYITKRPMRERLLREREKRLLTERCGVTTDDDVTEMKLGRHWTRDERKRHLRHAREKKRRREHMQRCRLEVLKEIAPADGEIVELRQKKVSKQKQKRMLLDNFVTVKELVAHGDRTNDIAKFNPLLSVTYI